MNVQQYYRVPKVVNVEPPPFSYIFDDYSGALAGYSLKKLRSAYSGNCIRVRRSSDNTLQDIGFSGVDLDTASLLSFVGAGNGFVETWYDQSVNAAHVAQATNGSQPKIVNSGSLYLDANGNPQILFSGNPNYLFRSTAFDLYNRTIVLALSVYLPNLAGNQIPMVESNSGNNTPFGLYNYNISANGSDLGYVTTFIRNNGNTANIQWPNVAVNERTDSNPVIVATAFPGSGSAETDSYIQLNGNAPNLRTMAKVASSVDRFALGYTIRPSPAQVFAGYMQENLLWEADLRSDISDIVDKENNYYQHY